MHGSATFKYARLPTIVPRGSPLPESQRTPTNASLSNMLTHLQKEQEAATKQLEQEWRDFAAGRHALPWRSKTMTRWHAANGDIVRVKIAMSRCRYTDIAGKSAAMEPAHP